MHLQQAAFGGPKEHQTSYSLSVFASGVPESLKHRKPAKILGSQTGKQLLQNLLATVSTEQRTWFPMQHRGQKRRQKALLASDILGLSWDHILHQRYQYQCHQQVFRQIPYFQAGFDSPNHPNPTNFHAQLARSSQHALPSSDLRHEELLEELQEMRHFVGWRISGWVQGGLRCHGKVSSVKGFWWGAVSGW